MKDSDRQQDASKSVPIRCTECGAVTWISGAEFHPARRETVLTSLGWSVRWGIDPAYLCPDHPPLRIR